MTKRETILPSTLAQIHYTDRTPSREIEDWETSGEEEMNRLHEECKQYKSRIEAEHNEKYLQNKRKASVLHVRDSLNNIKDLLTLCREALSESQLDDIKEIVADVLYFHVEEQIKRAEEELAQV